MAPWGFITSITRAGKPRTIFGARHLLPGTDCHEFDVLGGRVPKEQVMDSICKNCFRLGLFFQGLFQA